MLMSTWMWLLVLSMMLFHPLESVAADKKSAFKLDRKSPRVVKKTIRYRQPLPEIQTITQQIDQEVEMFEVKSADQPTFDDEPLDSDWRSPASE
ncbi:MAG: hypothetical protein AB7F59_01950 [Bdellovibrionales bacterium]